MRLWVYVSASGYQLGRHMRVETVDACADGWSAWLDTDGAFASSSSSWFETTDTTAGEE